jgi:hypothetical protein
MFAPAAKVVCGELGEQLKALMLPTLTLGTQLAAVAVLALMLVQVAVKPVITWPGLTTVGVVAPKVADMSVAPESTAAVTEPVHAGAPVQEGSPPPIAEAVLFPPVAPTTADVPTVIGTEIVIGPAVFIGIVQPDKLFEPVATPHDTPLTKTCPLVVIPNGSVSVIVIAAVVGPLATAILMV